MATPTEIVTICDRPEITDEIKAATGCPGYNGTTPIETVVTNILNGVIAVLGLVCVVFIIYGGVQYMTSVGDAGKVQKAKHTIMYACIGLVICVLAFAITNFIISILGGSSTPTPAQ